MKKKKKIEMNCKNCFDEKNIIKHYLESFLDFRYL